MNAKSTPGLETLQWDERLYVSGYRLGCDSGNPNRCVDDATNAVTEKGFTRMFLSMPVDAAITPGDARKLSSLSVSRPFLAEAGFDDFVDRYGKLFSISAIDPAAWLQGVVQQVKSSNSGMAFGITLYEDQLDSPFLRAPALPVELAQEVGYVHLYLHYRADAPHFSQYVVRTKELFPRARVIAGLYAYDRIDYIPCDPANKLPCSAEQEIHLYEQAAYSAAQLLKQGVIDGIEFYPGFFGRENEWPGWKHEDYCAQSRRAQCLENTRIMREKTVEVIDSALQ